VHEPEFGFPGRGRFAGPYLQIVGMFQDAMSVQPNLVEEVSTAAFTREPSSICGGFSYGRVGVVLWLVRVARFVVLVQTSLSVVG